jgi:hypothetical protein
VSEHSDNKQASIGAIVMLLIIAGLVVWGIGLMNNGAYAAAGGAGILLFLFGLYAVFSLGRG